MQFAIRFQLAPESLGSAIEVLLRRAHDRWVAEVSASTDRHVGLGPSPRAALTAALAPMGASASTAFLADVGLLRPSCELLAAETAARG